MYQNDYNQIRTMNITMSVNEILNQLYEGIIQLDENFQRSLRWSNDKQSLFIDSLINNYPIPSLFFYEEEYNMYTIIDGIQRLIAISNYIFKKNYTKNNLTHYGRKFEELSEVDKKRLLNARIPITIIAYMDNSQEVITDIFYRLNIGGSSLNNQELRNRMFAGELLDQVELLSEKNCWRSIYRSQVSNRYRDYELILKFFTAIDRKFGMYKASDSINHFLQENRFNQTIADEYSSVFLETIDFVRNSLGDEALIINNRFSIALYDTLFIPLGFLITEGKQISNINEKYVHIMDVVYEGRLKGRRTDQRIAIGYRILMGEHYEF